MSHCSLGFLFFVLIQYGMMQYMNKHAELTFARYVFACDCVCFSLKQMWRQDYPSLQKSPLVFTATLTSRPIISSLKRILDNFWYCNISVFSRFHTRCQSTCTLKNTFHLNIDDGCAIEIIIKFRKRKSFFSPNRGLDEMFFRKVWRVIQRHSKQVMFLSLTICIISWGCLGWEPNRNNTMLKR